MSKFQNHFSPRKKYIFDPNFFFNLEFFYTFDFAHSGRLWERMGDGRPPDWQMFMPFLDIPRHFSKKKVQQFDPHL